MGVSVTNASSTNHVVCIASFIGESDFRSKPLHFLGFQQCKIAALPYSGIWIKESLRGNTAIGLGASERARIY